MKIISALIITAVFSLNAFAQDAQSIIDKHIAAVGGKKNWAKIETLKITSIERSIYDTTMLTTTKIRNKAFRADMVSHKQNNIELFAHNEGWTINNGRKTKTSPREYRIFKQGTQIEGDLFDYKKSGCTAQYIKADTLYGKKCYVAMVAKEGDVILYYFDATSYYILKETFGYPANNMIYSDFKKFPEGIVMPMTITISGTTINVLNVEINKPIDKSVFDSAKL